MFDLIVSSLNWNAQRFVSMWVEAMEIALAPHPAEQIIELLERVAADSYSFRSDELTLNQRRLASLLTWWDVDAYKAVCKKMAQTA